MTQISKRPRWCCLPQASGSAAWPLMVVVAAALANPAAAELRGNSILSGAEPGIVLGESPARTCYEHAVAGRATLDALADCDSAFAVPMSRLEITKTYINRGVIHSLRGDYDGALRDYLAAIRRHPGIAIAHINAAKIYLQREQWREALQSLDRALALQPDAPEQAHFLRAIANEELGNVRAAFDDYRAAADLAPAWDAPRAELRRFQVRKRGE